MRSNVALLYLSKALQMIFPLLVTIVISRRFSKVEFGYVLICQSLAVTSSAIIEYGFNYYGARFIGENRRAPKIYIKFMNDVNFSKLILFIPSLALSLVILKISNVPYIYWSSSILMSFGFGMSMLWFYQGIDKIRNFILIDILIKALTFIVVFLAINSAFVYLYLMALPYVLVNLFFWINEANNIGKLQIDLKSSLKLIKEGFNLFLFRVGSLIYGGASTALLGINFPPQIVAIYGGADRLYRAMAGLTAPVGDAFFANISFQIKHDPVEGKKIYKKAIKIVMSVAIILTLIGEIFSPLIIRIILGDGYLESIQTLRILVASIPFIGIGTSIFVLYLLPRGVDKYFSMATLIAGVWTVSSVIFMVPRLGINWMAYTILIAEILITCVGVYAVIRVRSQDE